MKEAKRQSDNDLYKLDKDFLDVMDELLLSKVNVAPSKKRF